MRNKNEYIAVELQPKNAMAVMCGRLFRHAGAAFPWFACELPPAFLPHGPPGKREPTRAKNGGHPVNKNKAAGALGF